ncbi:hypothetical protein GCM10010439_44650 [Actinocorallia aurantiaca]|uniref:Uncharacterized protein n=1 Tax=Actinocorallia aurantiaca TaxID=46204 RepID=A0ABN3UEP8_9ACTN
MVQIRYRSLPGTHTPDSRPGSPRRSGAFRRPNQAGGGDPLPDRDESPFPEVGASVAKVPAIKGRATLPAPPVL